MTTDSRHAIGDCDTCKTTAIIERRITDSRYAVGYRDTCKTTAIIERRTTDSRYRFAVIFGGNHNIRNIPGYPCYDITFTIIIQGVFQLFGGGFLTAYSAVAVRKIVFGISVFFFTTCYGTVMPMVRFIFRPFFRKNVSCRRNFFCFRFVAYRAGINFCACGRTSRFFDNLSAVPNVFGISVFFFTTCRDTGAPMVRFIFRPFFRKNVSCRRDFFCFRFVAYRAGINFYTCGRTSRFFGNLSAVPNVFGFVAHFVTVVFKADMPMVRFIACPRCGIGMRMRRLIIAAVTAVVSCTAVIVVAVVASNKPERAG